MNAKQRLHIRDFRESNPYHKTHKHLGPKVCGVPRVTYNDEEDEVDEVVEGVGIHDVVHDLHPALQSDHLHIRHQST